MIKTFRGLLTDGGQDRIRLSTIKGKVGYRIVKFKIITQAPGTVRVEHIVKIYKVEQTTVDGIIDMTDSDIIAVSLYAADSGAYTAAPIVVIMDQEIFNQDIYITGIDVNSSEAVNYYIELEVIPLDDLGAEYTTLKDMRST